MRASEKKHFFDFIYTHPFSRFPACLALSLYAFSGLGENPEGAFPWAAGVVSRVDAFDTISLKYNGHDRIAEREALYFRTVQPYERHSSIPTIFVYNYCMCLFPEESQRPSGSSNASRIDNITFTFKFTRDAAGASAIVEDGSVTIVTRSYNVMKIAGGMAAKRFA